MAPQKKHKIGYVLMQKEYVYQLPLCTPSKLQINLFEDEQQVNVKTSTSESKKNACFYT